MPAGAQEGTVRPRGGAGYSVHYPGLPLTGLSTVLPREAKEAHDACLPASESGARLTGPGSALGQKAKDLSNLRPSSTA